MKVLFMGTPDFAAVILEKIIEAGHEVIGVVTQPDKVKGRGKILSLPPVKKLAIKHDITVLQPIKVKELEFIQIISRMAPDIIVVAAFGQLLPEDLLDIPSYGCINVHASLLPKYRGASPIQYAIIDGEDETGITIQYMDVKLDAGDIILQKKLLLDSKDTGGSLHDKLAILGAQSLIEAMELIKDNKVDRIPQNELDATYVKKINKTMGNIDFALPAVNIERLIRGLNPWPSAFTLLDGKTLKLWDATVEKTKKKAAPGEVVSIRDDAIVVMTGEDTLVIKELQLEGKKRLKADAFLRGYNIPIGTVLGSI